MSETKYNPADKGKAFNEETKIQWEEIEREDFEQAVRDRERLKSLTRDELGE